VHLLIEKVEIFADKEKTDFHIVSTLESVSENLVPVVGLEPTRMISPTDFECLPRFGR
jgi:hypothetical protein